jgi:hypothetical protein
MLESIPFFDIKKAERVLDASTHDVVLADKTAVKALITPDNTVLRVSEGRFALQMPGFLTICSTKGLSVEYDENIGAVHFIGAPSDRGLKHIRIGKDGTTVNYSENISVSSVVNGTQPEAPFQTLVFDAKRAGKALAAESSIITNSEGQPGTQFVTSTGRELRVFDKYVMDRGQSIIAVSTIDAEMRKWYWPVEGVAFASTTKGVDRRYFNIERENLWVHYTNERAILRLRNDTP